MQAETDPRGARTLAIAKLTPRLSSPRPVPRAQIIDRLRAAEAMALVLVHGPAGFGKTTVMLQYYAQLRSRGVACSWLTLDTADNELPRFLDYLGEALRVIAPDLQPGEVESGAALPDLAARLAALPGRFVLFLDDFECIDSPVILGLVRQLTDYLPQGGQIVVGSRTVPELALGRLRAHGQLLEIQPADLRFSSTETAAFLRQQRGLALGNDDILRLQQRTQGWPAALWLVSIALRDRAHPKRFVETFDGSNASIADYLVEDVLARQPSGVRNFLLKVSVLDHFSAPLADAVLERSDSAELLARIERAHLFLVPQDGERRWFRFHPLFRGFLLAQLAHVAPDEIPRLHRRAAQWWLAQGRPTRAIEHALRCDDSTYLMDLLVEHAPQLLWQGRSGTLARWWEQHEVASRVMEHIPIRPTLATAFAWALILTHRHDEARRLLDALDGAQRAGALSAANLMPSDIRAPRAFLLAMSDRIRAASQLWQVNRGEVTPEQPFTFAMQGTSQGFCLLAEGRFEQSRTSLAQARNVAAMIGGSFIVPMAVCLQGAIELTQGRLRNAATSFRAALTGSGTDGPPQRDTVAAVFLAEALYLGNELEEAERLLTLFLPLLPKAAAPDQLITAYVLLGRIAGARGDHEAAEARLAEMEAIGQHTGLSRMVATARLERGRQALLQGRTDFAASQLDSGSDPAVWSDYEGLVTQANDSEAPFVGALRLKIHTGRAEAAVAPLKEALKEAEAQQRLRRGHQLALLLVEALCLSGQVAQGMRRLRDELQFAAGEGFVRSFVDEGPELLRRLAELRKALAEGEALAVHADRILAGSGLEFAAEPVAPPSPLAPVDSGLSEREVQVLRLLAEGYRNKEIAVRLFVSETTVKAHLRNINSKLGARCRTQAVAMGRQLGLVT